MTDDRVKTNPTQRVPVSELRPGDRIKVQEETGKAPDLHLIRYGRFIRVVSGNADTLVLYEDDIGEEREAFISEIIQHERQQHDQDL